MLKADLIADLTAKNLRVINTTKASDPTKEAAGVNTYIANVLEQDGEIVFGRNIAFYVVDEGLATEAAYYKDIPISKNSARTAMENFLAGLVPATYIRTQIDSVDEVNLYGFATAYKPNADGVTATTVKLLVWKDGASPIAYRELI